MDGLKIQIFAIPSNCIKICFPMLTFAFSSLNHSPVPRSLSILFFLEYPLSNCLIFFFQCNISFLKKAKILSRRSYSSLFQLDFKKKLSQVVQNFILKDENKINLKLLYIILFPFFFFFLPIHGFQMNSLSFTCRRPGTTMLIFCLIWQSNKNKLNIIARDYELLIYIIIC